MGRPSITLNERGWGATWTLTQVESFFKHYRTFSINYWSRNLLFHFNWSAVLYRVGIDFPTRFVTTVDVLVQLSLQTIYWHISFSISLPIYRPLLPPPPSISLCLSDLSVFSLSLWPVSGCIVVDAFVSFVFGCLAVWLYSQYYKAKLPEAKMRT